MSAGVELTEKLLGEQALLTPVADYASRHGAESNRSSRYQALIPLTAPQPGEQYAFEVDLDKCSGCKACVTACHSLNGLDDNEAWRETGLLTTENPRRPYQQVVTSACHHCVDPACLNGCPVLAYEKDPATGIVRHLDDQCIGCQYCILMCPYEVPKYSEARGIVRKCDMCSHRLSAGEAPACVQACPNDAISITLVNQVGLEALYRPDANNLPGVFLPDSPDPSITLPTTRYVSAHAIHKGIRSADHAQFQNQLANFSLVLMLVGTQLAVGLLCASTVLQALGDATMQKPLTAFAFLSLAVGIAASIFHLGRPLGAWRSFLGLRTSWLSREIAIFGAVGFLTLVHTAVTWLSIPVSSHVQMGVAAAVSITGLAGVFASAMIYHKTARPFWKLSFTGLRFFTGVLLLGASGLLTLVFIVIPSSSAALWCLLTSGTATLMKSGLEASILRYRELDDYSPLHKTATLLSEKFGLAARWRIAFYFAGGLVLPALLAMLVMVSGSTPGSSARIWWAAAGFSFCLIGELIDRWLFFRAVQTTKMPGGLA